MAGTIAYSPNRWSVAGGAGVWTLINHPVASVVYKHLYAFSLPSLHPVIPPLRRAEGPEKIQVGMLSLHI